MSNKLLMSFSSSDHGTSGSTAFGMISKEEGEGHDTSPAFEVWAAGCGDHYTSIALTMNSKMLEDLGKKLLLLALKYKEYEKR